MMNNINNRDFLQALKAVKNKFGKEILIDKAKFLSAFGDIAPSLSKEKRILSLALDEGIGHIFFDADGRGKDIRAREKAVANALKKLKKGAWLSEQAAAMITECFAAALEWKISSGRSQARTQTQAQATEDYGNTVNINADVKNDSPEELYIKARRAYNAKDYKTAALLYIAAAARGEAAAQNETGRCYEYGYGVSEDKPKAFEWYLKAAAQDYAEAQFNAGRCYCDGTGVQENKLKAFEWYLKSAEQGYAPAQIYVGYAYFNGSGTITDKRKAFEWYLKAANCGHAYAQNEVGYCCHTGSGTVKDKYKAFEWYLRAAKQENAAAQFNAGWCYQYGEGVKKSIGKAKRWYRESARNGNADAREKLRESFAFNFFSIFFFAKNRRA